MNTQRSAPALRGNPDEIKALEMKPFVDGAPPEINSNNGSKLLMANNSIATEKSDTATLA